MSLQNNARGMLTATSWHQTPIWRWHSMVLEGRGENLSTPDLRHRPVHLLAWLIVSFFSLPYLSFIFLSHMYSVRDQPRLRNAQSAVCGSGQLHPPRPLFHAGEALERDNEASDRRRMLSFRRAHFLSPREGHCPRGCGQSFFINRRIRSHRPFIECRPPDGTIGSWNMGRYSGRRPKLP